MTAAVASRPAAPAPQAAPPEEQMQIQVDEATHTLVANLVRVEVTIPWFAGAKAVNEEHARRMRNTIRAEKKGVAISKRLFGSDSPWVRACNEAKSAIHEFVNSRTIPEVALAPTGNKVRKKAGCRLIDPHQVADFDAGIQARAEVLRVAVENLQNHIAEVKATDRARLGESYNEADYPEDLRELVRVEVSYPPSERVAISLREAAPEIYARENQRARETCEQVVHHWTVEFGQTFQNFIEQFVEQLGFRTRLDPVDDAKWTGLKDAEVVKILHNEDDPNIPSGKIAVQIRPQSGTSRDDRWLAPMTNKEFQDALRPYETGERRKVYASTIDCLKHQLETFRNTAEMFGPHRTNIESAVDRVHALLRSVSSQTHTADIARELRDSERSRNDVRRALQQVSLVLTDSISTANSVRRRVIDLD